MFVGTLLAAGFVVAFAASKKDPVLMKVDGKPVTLSEFEYMYHKNNQQRFVIVPIFCKMRICADRGKFVVCPHIMFDGGAYSPDIIHRNQ